MYHPASAEGLPRTPQRPIFPALMKANHRIIPISQSIVHGTLSGDTVLPAVSPEPTFLAGRPSATNPASAGSLDKLNRPLHDLRISVTDRCNFRCVYCMPKTIFDSNYSYLPRVELLSFEEIERVARLFVAQGVEKIRITGGEPLLRRGLEKLIEQLAKLAVEVTLTTNGALLAKKAQRLKDAGLKRITVSLDALDDATFKRMNDVDFAVNDVLHGIEAAAKIGLAPIKINCVVKRGMNDDQMLPLARHFRGSGHILRFIEFMDVGNSNGWKLDDMLPSREVITRIHAEFPLAPASPNYPGEVATRWRYLDGQGEIGVISAVTQAFCASCTRLRLSTEGQLYTCLFARQGHDIRTLLRNGSTDKEISQAIANVWLAREDRYSALRSHAPNPMSQPSATPEKIEMSYIGG
ncbi:MAG: GTP 3',8-cyclase [Rugosibacter sp.]|nr:GTP 3',8-cyclase [Rugosibacter sp.]